MYVMWEFVSVLGYFNRLLRITNLILMVKEVTRQLSIIWYNCYCEDNYNIYVKRNVTVIDLFIMRTIIK